MKLIKKIIFQYRLRKLHNTLFNRVQEILQLPLEESLLKIDALRQLTENCTPNCKEIWDQVEKTRRAMDEIEKLEGQIEQIKTGLL
jgi:hypothetical protein